jgi:hypothetical protein
MRTLLASAIAMAAEADYRAVKANAKAAAQSVKE